MSESASLFVKDMMVNILGFVGHLVSAVATQLGHCSVKAAIDDM